jgi:8-oxo-dGTP pyrophosphatase MutT (NUDIX family)
VELQSGQKIEYLRYGYGGDGVVIIARNDQEQVLFISEYSYVPNRKLLQLPMGKVEENESPEEAANRELQEEGGFKAKQLKLLGCYFQNHRRSTNKGHVVLASGLTQSSLMGDPEEVDIEKVWLSAEDISSLIEAGEIMDADTLSSIRIGKF